MKKILVIEDAEEVLNFVQNALRSNGFQTMGARNGKEGVALVMEQMPDLVLCDVIMPVLDGYGTLAALRADPRTAHIPLIFLTGYSDRHRVRQGMELGADDYLGKPFTMDELLGAVNSRLQKQAVLTAQSEKMLEELRGSIRFALPHELMTPLTCILGFSAMLTESFGTLTPGQVFEFGNHINLAATRLQAIIENFLLYSHLEVISADPERAAALRDIESISIKPAVEHSIRQALKRHMREDDFQTEVQDCAHSIAPAHLEKLLGELLDNAFKFSEKGKKIYLKVKRNQKEFEITVTDQGRGMTPEQIQRIGAHMQFERHVHEQQGSGLGLAISKRLVKLYGGQCVIESAAGAGTTVRIVFPVREVQSAQA